MTNLDPKHAIFPIVKQNAEGSITALLGTGFFVGPRPAAVTAKHVFHENPITDGEAYALAYFDEQGAVQLAQINGFVVSPDFDVLVFAAGGLPVTHSLELSPNPVPTSESVLTYEFSSTWIEEQAGNRIVRFEPFTHMGNAMRHYASDFPETVPTPCFDTSFPALQGASGAPVVRASDFTVVGMLVSNHERHLIPAQVVRVEQDAQLVEEVRYFLPTGKALAGSILVDFLQSANAEPVVVE